jgi:recombinational DNA repair ATPase RecF
MSKIIELRAENFKRLKAVRITPDGHTTIVGGANAQGKTSVLDAFEAALGGKGSVPQEALRRGSQRGYVVLDLDDIVVKRTFTDGGSALTVSSKDGAPVKSPQAMLDKLVGSLSFDPLRFTRMDPKEQVATLRSLVGLDFSALDAERAKTYEARTENGRELKRTGALREQAPYYDDAPAKEASVAELLAELEVRRKQNLTVKSDREKLAAMRAASIEVDAKIARLEAELAALREEQAERIKTGKAFAMMVGALVEANEAEIVERLSMVEESNAKARANAACIQLEADMQRLTRLETEMTARIAAIDEQKREQLADAQFAVPGLAFDDGGVTLNGIPFSQASSAEQLRVSVAIGLAMNPALKVLLIRDGSLLDEKSLAAIAAQAEAANAQLIIERVSADGEGCSVVIEDGEVRGAAKAGAA